MFAHIYTARTGSLPRELRVGGNGQLIEAAVPGAIVETFLLSATIIISALEGMVVRFFHNFYLISICSHSHINVTIT